MTLSVLTPVFNAVHLVAPFVDMLLRQTRMPEAVVLVDDGSADGTDAALIDAMRRLEAAGVTCHLITHPENRGRGAARRSALETATTRMATWLDIDDLYGPERLERLAAALSLVEARDGEGTAPWLLSTPYTLCQGARIEARRAVPAREIVGVSGLYEAGMGHRTPQLQALAGPRETWRAIDFDPELNWAEDLDFAIRFLGRGGRILTAPPPRPEDVVYFQSFDRTSHDTVARANRRVHDKNAALLRDAGLDPKAELEGKLERYVSKFGAKDASNAASISPPSRLVAPDGLMGLRLEETSSGVRVTGGDAEAVSMRFHMACGSPLARPVPERLCWSDIAAAFSTQAVQLRLTWRSDGVERVLDYAIHRDAEGLFGLTLAADLRSSAADAKLRAAPWSTSGSTPGRFVPFRTSLGNGDAPLFVSFFAGAPSYRQNADRLATALESWGVDFEICEFKPDGPFDWTRLCRKKIAYYAAQRDRWNRTIFWLDVDTQLIGDPRTLGMGADHDITGFLRNFEYLVDFDPYKFARLLHPGYLCFGTGPRVDRFFAHLKAVDAMAPDNATDDWVLQEALTTAGEKLSFGLFSPDAIVTNVEAERGSGAVFQHADSGNVAHASKAAAQHQSLAMSPPRQMAVLREAATQAMRNGAPGDAAVFYRRMRKVDPDDPEPVNQLLNHYLRTDQPKKFHYHFDIAKTNPAVRVAALRVRLDKAHADGDSAAVERTATELRKEGGGAFVAARAFRHGFDREARRMGADPTSRVDMMWWEQPYPGNLGDMLGPLVVQAMTGIPPRYSKASPRMLSIGSIIRFAQAGDTVWTSGASSQSQSINPNAVFRAVRGPLTRRMVLKAGGTCPEVYGDAAWFVPMIRPFGRIAKTHRLGLIRHFAHASRPLTVAPDVREIDIIRTGAEGVDRFLEEMNGCEAIVSTSLHGVILAQAYGIPVAWAIDSASSRQIHGDGMKFRDYALSVGSEEYTPLDLSAVPRIDASLAARCIHAAPIPPDLMALAKAAPFEVSAAFMDGLSGAGSP